MIDYASAGTFALAGALMMGSKKRAGLASILCGAAQAGLVMMTDMPGGVFRVIRVPTHLKIDGGFSAGVAMLPTVLAFSDELKSWLFRAQAMNIAAVTAMTQSEETGRRRRYDGRRAA
jgi:hypothetical protein